MNTLKTIVVSLLARPPIGWALVTAGGLILALAGALASPGDEGAATPGTKLHVQLPDVVAMTVVVLFTLAAVLLMALLWPRAGWRRRKKKDDEFEMYYEPPKVSAWAQLVVLLVALLPFAVAGWLLWHGGHGRSSVGSDRRAAPAASVPSGAISRGGAEKGAISIPVFDMAVAVLGIVGGVVALGVIAWLYLGDRLERWWEGRIFDDVAQPLREPVGESLEELRAEPDARMAIIKCYRRFEQVLAGTRMPRAPWETPVEYMRAVLARLTLPREAVVLLTGLFELSRFSDRTLGATERDIACDCLSEIGAALEEKRDAAATA